MKRILTRIADRLDELEDKLERDRQHAAKQSEGQTANVESLQKAITQLQGVLVDVADKVGQLHARFIEQADRSGTEHRDHERRLKLLEGSGTNGAGGE